MKNKLTLFIILALLISTVIVLASCGETPQNTDTSTDSSTDTGTGDNKPDVPTECIIEEAEGFEFDTTGTTPKIYKNVSNSTEIIDLSGSINVTEGCTWKMYKDFLGEDEYKLKSMSLSIGENKAYIVVYHPDGETFTRYELVLYRLDMKEYSFTKDNVPYNNGTVEELSSVESPATNPQKTGYDFIGWTVNGEFVSFPYQVNEDTVFEAKFAPIEYEIEYNLNGGANNAQNSLKYTIEQSVTLLEPTREFYTFAGWYESDNFEGNAITEIAEGSYGNKTFYAKWTPITYDISYVLNGGTNDAENPSTYNTEISVELKAPTKAGYNFAGWFIDEGFENQSSGISLGEGDAKTFYAKWNANENTIVFNSNSGSGSMINMTVATDSTVKLTTNAFEKAGYTFMGWSTSASGNVEYTDGASYTMGTDSTYTLYAVWQVNINGVVFNANGGKGTMSSLELATGITDTLPKNTFTKDGYTFKGWATTKGGSVAYTDGAGYTMGTNSTYTLYAVWEANKNTLVFDANGGTGSMSNMIIATDSQAKLTSNAFTKANYTFKGWATSKNGSVVYTNGASYTMGTNNSYTLYAVWQVNTYNITYVLNGGTNNTNSTTYTVEQAITLKDPSRAGYTFDGWYSDSSFNNKVTGISLGTTGNKTFYAKWTANENTLVFNANGGSGSMSNMTIATDSTAKLTSNAFTRNGYTFKGWATSKNGNVVYTNGASYKMGTNSSYTLYAVWEAISYSITYNLNGFSKYIVVNSTNNPTKYTHQDKITLSPPTINSNYYDFIGWYTDENCKNQITKIENNTGDIILYAKWVTSDTALTFTEVEGGYSVTGCVTDIDVVIVPEAYNGLPVTSIGSSAFFDCDSLTSVTIGDSVTTIGESAFSACTSLTSITIPDSVTTIGDGAFGYCYNLTEINFNATAMNDLSEDNHVFTSAGTDTNGIKVTIGKNVTKIPAYLFYPCNYSTYLPNITSVVFEEGSVCESIGSHAFRDCDILSVGIPDSVTTIGDYAFYNCSSLTSVTIGDSVTTIGEYAFRDCTSLTEINFNATAMNDLSKDNYVFYNAGKDGVGIKVTIGKDVTKIPAYLFYPYSSSSSYSPKIISVEFEEESVCEIIGSYAFYACTSLTSVTIGNSVTSIESRAFYDCTSLTSVTIGDGVTTIGSSAFYNCTSLTSITFPDSVTSIGSSAFDGCSSLTSVTIGDGVTTIGSSAFYNCTSLTEINFNATAMNDLSEYNNLFYNAGKNGKGIKVTIGKNVTKIPAYLFYPYSSSSSYSPKITSVVFEKGSVCESIGSSAFGYCTSLQEVHISDIASWCNISFGGLYANPLCYAKKLYLNQILVKNLIIPNTVKEIKPYAFYDCTSLTSITIPNSVTTIGDDAFRYCTSLTSIIIPDSVTSIGDYAFYNCSSLTSVTIGDSVTTIGEYAFDGCRSLTSITIPDSLTTIGSSAFYNCTSLTSIITLPDSVTSIGDYAFYNCSSLTSVTIGDSVTTIGEYAFRECTSLTSVTIGDGVTTIGSSAFYNCTSLTSITLPDSVTSIGSSAFDGCTSLQEVHISDIASWCNISFDGLYANPLCYAEKLYLNEILVKNLIIPNTVKEIKPYAFYDCTSLTSITIPNSVTTIGDHAFSYCPSLTSVTIPDSVTSIGDYAFSDCDSLTSITIPDSVTSIGSYAFFSCDSLQEVHISDIASWCNISFDGSYANPLYYAEKLYLNEILVKNLIIPNTVKEIKPCAFYNCTSLASITIPDSVASIGSYAFRGCISLTSITIPDSVTSIGHDAFLGCSSLTSITIPDSVTTIGSYAFFNCNSLTSVTFENTSGWWCSTSSTATSGTSISSTNLSNTSTAAKYLVTTYYYYYWKRS